MKKKYFKRFLITLGIVPGLMVLYLTAAYTLSSIPVNTSFKEPKDGVDIFIQSNGVHTDIVVPAFTEWIDWRKKIRPEYFKGEGSDLNYLP